MGPMGLMSDNLLEQQAAVYSLCTLMSIAPEDAYSEFEKVLLVLIQIQLFRFFFSFLGCDYYLPSHCSTL